MIKLLALLAALPAAVSAQNLSYSQLSAARGASPAEALVPPPPQYAPAETGCRFPTASHVYFNSALILGIRAEDPEGDFYPFAGGTPGKTDENGNAVDQGLLSGMGSESGHPGIFANGGDPKDLWEHALKEYRALRFAGAYELIGLVCHLTQDQAVPPHAANINHVITFGDRFEKTIKKDLSLFEKLRGRVQAAVLPSLPPYEYYQVLQDDTRRHLNEWKDPKSGLPYWPPAPDAPPLGQDSTKGPWSHYSNKTDTYDIGVSPEIMDRQMLQAAVYTSGVLKAAAKLLPPALGGLEALRVSSDKRSETDLSFDVYDNRRGEVTVTIERPLYGYSEKKVLSVVSDGRTVPSASFSVRLPALKEAVKGKDLIVITAVDADGNAAAARTEVRFEEPVDYGSGG